MPEKMLGDLLQSTFDAVMTLDRKFDGVVKDQETQGEKIATNEQEIKDLQKRTTRIETEFAVYKAGARVRQLVAGSVGVTGGGVAGMLAKMAMGGLLVLALAGCGAQPAPNAPPVVYRGLVGTCNASIQLDVYGQPVVIEARGSGGNVAGALDGVVNASVGPAWVRCAGSAGKGAPDCSYGVQFGGLGGPQDAPFPVDATDHARD